MVAEVTKTYVLMQIVNDMSLRIIILHHQNVTLNFNAVIKSLRPNCFLNRAFRQQMCEKPTNTTIIH
jgi:hypothetical protein